MTLLTPPTVLPEPFEWLPVAAGQVTLETGQTIAVPAFEIARYPITNRQYAAFVQADEGYALDRWWDYSDEARQFHSENPQPPPTAVEGDLLPRTNVSWFEALAFCRWLSASAGARISLPDEAQWQLAAAGETGWRYPWGSDFDASRCNFHSEAATPVTDHPTGASPCGALDMSGNVWEWCLNDYLTGSDDVTLQVADRVLRGGSWWCNDPGDLAVDYRSGGYVTGWSHDWGFRPVRLPDEPPVRRR